MKPIASIRGYRWLILVLLVLAGALNYGDRTAFSTVLPLLRADLHASDAALGWIGAVFLWSYGLFSPVAGVLGDRLPRARVVALCLGTWSAVMMLTGWSSTLAVLLGMRVLLGLAESFYIPSACGLLAEHHPTATRATAMGIHTSGYYLGMVCGGSFAGYVGQLYGWRYTVKALGLAGLILAAICLFLLRSPQRPAEERPPTASLGQSLSVLLHTPAYLVLVAQSMLVSMANWTFLYWLPLYFHETFRLSLAQAGVAGTLPSNGGAVLGILAGGWLSDRIARNSVGKRMRTQCLFYIASAPLLLVFLATPSITLMYGVVFVYMLLRNMGQVAENPLICDILPSSCWSTGTGLFNCTNCLAGGLALLLTGVFKSRFGLDAIFGSISVIMLIGAALLAFGYLRYFRSRSASSLSPAA
jgi:predicted MFS family arabinose efflux permease